MSKIILYFVKLKQNNLLILKQRIRKARNLLTFIYYLFLAKLGIEPKLTDHETIVPPLHYFAYIFFYTSYE